MARTMIIPPVGKVLRTLITRGGYRGHLIKMGLDKDLDDLANESREGSTCDLMLAIVDACSKELALDCGVEWSQVFESVWNRTRNAIQQLVIGVDTSAFAEKEEEGQAEVLRQFDIPMLSGFFRLVTALRPGPEISLWWESPIASWIQYASSKAKISNDDLLTNFANHLNADPRSIDRWLAGEPTGKLCWPYRPTVRETIGKDAENRLGADGIDQITGWLIIAVAFQSLPTELRDRVRRDYDLRPQQPWSLEYVIRTLNKQGFEHRNRPVRASVVPLMQKIEQLFAIQPRDIAEIQRCLEAFQALISQENTFWQRSYQYIHHWFSAHLAAITGQEEDALRLYEAAVAGVWWYGGLNQHPIIKEALLYAVGVGKKSAADHYWDKTLGILVQRDRRFWPIVTGHSGAS